MITAKMAANPEKNPNIMLQNIPDDVNAVILNKQCSIQVQQKKKLNKSQIVVLLIKEAYVKK